MAHDTPSSDDAQSPDAPTTEGEFQTRLFGLLTGAHANGVTVTGGWDSKLDVPDGPHWGVEIYEVADPSR
ncbi:MAG: hypothetical protein ABEJ70_05615 [Halobacteriaceae archaeon]